MERLCRPDSRYGIVSIDTLGIRGSFGDPFFQ